MYASGELPRHGEKPLLSRGRQVGLHPAHDRGASSSQTRKSVSCTGNGICKAAQGQKSRCPSRQHTPSLLEPRGRGGRLCSVGRAGPRGFGFAGKRGFSPRKTPSPPGSSSDFGGNPWRLPSHESRMALPLTSSPALQARPPSLTENEGPGRTGRSPGNAGVGVQTSHGACGGPDARDLRRADVSAAPLSPKPPASRTARESSSLPTFSSDGLCFFQVSDGAQSFVKELLSWKIPRTPSWAKSSVQRDTPPLEDEGSGSSPDGLRPAHLSPYRDAEQEVRGCRHAGARPGPTASPRDAWNSQPCSPSPRSPSPPPCGRTWAVRASSTERGKR